MNRCSWAEGHEIYEDYHDLEWGSPTFDDAVQFEFLVLESAQAGLSWLTVLRKRDNYRKAFANFDAREVAKFGKSEIDSLMNNTGIIRNKLKIEAAVNNAKVFLDIQKEYGKFSDYLWSFTERKQILGNLNSLDEMKANSELSKNVANDLKKRGMKFLGPTIMYSHMQAVGLINDHLVDCFRFQACLIDTGKSLERKK